MTREPWLTEPSAIDAVLRSYRRILPAQSLCCPVERPGFSGAVVLRIQTAAGQFCLRGWPIGTDDPERLLALHELLGYVHSRGIAYVAVPVPSDDDSTVVRASGRFWQLEPWLPGCADFWSRPNDARLSAAFTALARFHQAARDFQPTGKRKSHLGPSAPAIAPTVLDRIERIDRWNPDRLNNLRARIGEELATTSDGSSLAAVAGLIVDAFAQCASRVLGELRTAARVPAPLQPCLRDVWHDHVLFEGDAVTGLIDPSASRTDTIATDLSRLAGSLVGDDCRGWSVALEAYESIRPLSSTESTLVGILDRSGVLLSGMAWLERPDFWQPHSPEFRTRLLARLQKIAARAEAIVRSFE